MKWHRNFSILMYQRDAAKKYLLLLLLTLTSSTIFASTYYNLAGSDVSNTSSWGTSSDGSGAHPSDFNTLGDIFRLVNGATSTIGANWVMNNNTLIVGDGSAAINFTIPGAYSLTNSGTSVVNVSANATLTIQNDSYYPTFGSLDAASTVNYAAAATTQLIRSAVYGNLTLSNGSGSQLMGDVTVEGELLLSGNSVLDANGKSITINGTISGMNTSNYLNSNSWAANLTIGATSTPGTLYIGGGYFGNITVNAPGGSVMIAPAGTAFVSIFNSINIASGATLDMGTLPVLDGSGISMTTSISGTFKTECVAGSGYDPVPMGKTWGGDIYL